MKKVIVFFVVIAVSLSVPLIINNAHAGGKWKLYDNFDEDFAGDSFDPAKWEEIERGGIEVSHDDVNGRAKFLFHNGDQTGLSNWLKFIDCPENIVAIKATFITEGACTNAGVRGRIGLHEGTFEGMYSWHQMDIQPGDNKIWGIVEAQYDSVQDLWYTLFYGEFRKDLDLSNGSYTLEMYFDKKKAVFEGGDLGRLTFELPSALGGKTEIFRGIGLKANSGGSGDCTFYIDNVYVMRKGPCDKKAPKVKKYTKKGGPDLAYVDIMFNEPMNADFSKEITTHGPSDVFGPSWETMWLDGNKMLRVFVDANNKPLPIGKYEIILNMDMNNGFRDLKGNLLKEKTLKLKIK